MLLVYYFEGGRGWWQKHCTMPLPAHQTFKTNCSCGIFPVPFTVPWISSHKCVSWDLLGGSFWPAGRQSEWLLALLFLGAENCEDPASSDEFFKSTGKASEAFDIKRPLKFLSGFKLCLGLQSHSSSCRAFHWADWIRKAPRVRASYW